MSDVKKRIYFEVDSTEALSAFNQLRQIANEDAEVLIKGANRYAASGKDVLTFLKEEIKLLENRRKLEIEESRTTNEERFEKEYGRAKTDEARQKAKTGYIGREQEITEANRQGNRQVLLLKEIIDTLKQTARDEIKESRTDVEKQVQLYKEGKLKGLSPEEEAKIKLQQEILEGKKGGKGGQDQEKSRFWETAGAVFAGEVMSKIVERLTGVVTAESSEKAFTSLLGSIPVVGGILSGTTERVYEAQMSLETGRFGYFGATGRKRGYGGGYGTPYGYTTADLYGVGTELSRNRGMNAGLGSVLDIVSLERAFNLDKGQLYGLSRGERFGGRNSMENIGLVISTLKKEGLWGENTQIKIPEYLQQLVSLNEEQIKITGKVDTNRNLSNIYAISKLGERYVSDSSFLTGVSGAISHPQNEYQQARSLSSLVALNPNADLWELEKMQEKGLGQAGYMSGILGKLKQRYGKGENNLAQRALYNTLKGGGANISKQQAEDIWQAYLQEPGMWDKQSGVSEKDLVKFGRETRYTGATLTSEKLKDITQTTEDYTKGALPGAINLLDRTLNKITDKLEKAAENLGHKVGLSDETMKKVESGLEKVIMSYPNIYSVIKYGNKLFGEKNEVTNE
jgi:hypothetical protein